jgi:transposase
MSAPRFVGTGVSKGHLDAHIRPDGTAFRCPTDPGGLAAVVARLLAARPERVVLEATGGYEAPLAAALAAAGRPVVVVNPRQARRFAEATGRRAKTDALGAAALAHFAEAVRPGARPLPGEATRALAALVARRRQVIGMRAAELNRLGLAPAPLARGIRDHVAWLDRQLGRLDGELAAAIQASPVWRAKDDLLRDVPGIGPVVSRTLLSGLPEPGALSRERIAARVGVAPVARDSGRKSGAGRAPARGCTWRSSRRPGTTPRSGTSTGGCGRPARRSRWPRWPPCASS